MKMLPFLLSLLLCLSSLYGESSSPGDDHSGNNDSASALSELTALAEYLGRSLEDVISQEGLPDEMYTVRGPSEGQDSVVFFYKDRISMFWAESHVWQVRADSENLSDDSILKMGMSREELIAVLGEADLEKEDYFIYTLPQKGYPIACAVYFEEEGLSDLYIYRSDF